MNKKILLIYTGGTIGMIKNINTGVLQAFSLEYLLQKIPQLKSIKAKIDTLSVPNPKDSADIRVSDWQFLGQLIFDRILKYDGFVVLHGTDTMSYTASALSFMFSNLTKPIIFTGSQLPVGDVRTDALENVLTSIQISLLEKGGRPLITEVSLCFNGQLFRGNCSTKISSDNFKAFSSPNYPVLVSSGISLKVNTDKLIVSNFNKETSFNKNFEDSVFLLKIHPGISRKMFEQLCESVDFEVLILETYGSGTIFKVDWLSNSLKKIVKKGKSVINCSQCLMGVVEQGIYQGSEQLKTVGIINGKDITTEAAITKSMYLLSQKLDLKTFKKKFEMNLRGERH